MVVTGGASGMGQATVQRLLDEGAAVASIDRRTEGVPDGALALVADVGDEAAVEAAMNKAVGELGGVQGVATCAGVFVPGDGKLAADKALCTRASRVSPPDSRGHSTAKGCAVQEFAALSQSPEAHAPCACGTDTLVHTLAPCDKLV